MAFAAGQMTDVLWTDSSGWRIWESDVLAGIAAAVKTALNT